MAATRTPMFSRFRQWLTRSVLNPSPDAELVERFVLHRDDAAFAALLDRHGPMVLGVAQRVVGDSHAAEDVMQATFVMLARRARSLRGTAALPAWLHTTAYRLAVSALRSRKRRQDVECQAYRPANASPLDELTSRELLSILDEELQRLPETLRLPLILCALEGRSQEEVAAHLECTPDSVRGRLERGRQRLRARLARRGLTFAVGAGVPLLLGSPVVAGALRLATLQVALYAEGLSPAVAALVKGAQVPLLATHWKVLIVALALASAGLGGYVSLPGSPTPGLPAKPPAAALVEQPVPQRAVSADEALPEGAIVRLGSSKLRIGDSAFAFTPDETKIVAVSAEGLVRTFDAKTGQLLQRRQLIDRGDVYPVNGNLVQISSDAKIVAVHERVARTADDQDNGGRRVTVWDIESGKNIFRRDLNSHSGFAMAPNGKLLAVIESVKGEPTQVLVLHELQSGRKTKLGSVEINAYYLQFSRNGQRIFLYERNGGGSDIEGFTCFDVTKEKLLWHFPWKSQFASTFAVSPDGRWLVTQGREQKERELQVIETDPVTGKPAGRIMPFNRVPANREARRSENFEFVIAGDNRTLIIHQDQEIALWDLQAAKEIRRFQIPKRPWGWHVSEFASVSVDGRTLITNLGTLQRWDLGTGKASFETPPNDGMDHAVHSLAFTAESKELVAVSNDTARWDVATGKRIEIQSGAVGRLVFTTKGPIGLSSSESTKGVWLSMHDAVIFGKGYEPARWEVSSGVAFIRSSSTISADRKTVMAVVGSFEKQKTYVATFDFESTKMLTQFEVPGILRFQQPPFSPCGRWVVLRGKVLNVQTGKEVLTPTGETGERLVASGAYGNGPVWFSQDGKLLAGLLQRDGDKEPPDTLAVWEVPSGKLLTRLSNQRYVAQAVFGRDGQILATLDGRGVRVHEISTGKQLAAYPATDVPCLVYSEPSHMIQTQTLAISPDGRTLATGHLDGTVLLWKVPGPARK